MSWKKAGNPAHPLWGVALVMAPLLAAALSYAFYAPPRGQTAAGDPGKATPDQPRDRVRVRVEAHMAGRPGPPTLKDVVRFHGLEDDTLPCTVEENYGSVPKVVIPTYERRPMRPAEEVILCLD